MKKYKPCTWRPPRSGRPSGQVGEEGRYRGYEDLDRKPSAGCEVVDFPAIVVNDTKETTCTSREWPSTRVKKDRWDAEERRFSGFYDIQDSSSVFSA